MSSDVTVVTSQTVSGRLADYVCSVSYEDIPPTAVNKLKDVIVHDVAVAVAGSRTDEAGRALEFVRNSQSERGTSTIIGTCDKATVIEAAFANAVMIRALRQEDTILPSRTHAGPMLFPPAFAIAEHRGCSGRDVITALTAGYEVLAKVAGTGLTENGAVRTPSHIFGALGSAAVAAKLMDLDPDQTATALAYAGNLGATITRGFENHQYGVIVRNGITAARLGQARSPAPDDALEGDPGFYVAHCGRVPDDLEARLDALGSNDEVMSSILKTFPCTGGTLIPVQLVRRLLDRHGVAGDDVSRVLVSRSRRYYGARHAVHHKGPWPSASQSISSLTFAIAAVLLDGEVTAARLHQPDNPAIFDRTQNVDVEFIDVDDSRYHRVEIQTRDGRTLQDEGDATVLDPPNPAGTLRTFATDVIGTDNVARFLESVMRLEDLDSLDEVMACLTPEAVTAG